MGFTYKFKKMVVKDCLNKGLFPRIEDVADELCLSHATVRKWFEDPDLVSKVTDSCNIVESAFSCKAEFLLKCIRKSKKGTLYLSVPLAIRCYEDDYGVTDDMLYKWIDSVRGNSHKLEALFKEKERRKEEEAKKSVAKSDSGCAVGDRNMQENREVYKPDPDDPDMAENAPVAEAGQESCRVIDFSDDGNCCMQKPDSEVDFDRESDRNTQEEAADSDASVPDADEPTFIPYSVSEEDSTPSGTDSKPDDSAGAGAGYPGEDEVDFEKECNMKDGSQEDRLSGFEPAVFPCDEQDDAPSRELLSEDVLALFSGELSEGSITIGAGPYLFTLVRESSDFKVCISEGGTVLSLIPFSLSERELEYKFGSRGYSFSLHLSRCDVMTMSVTRKREIREDNPNGDRK